MDKNLVYSCIWCGKWNVMGTECDCSHARALGVIEHNTEMMRDALGSIERAINHFYSAAKTVTKPTNLSSLNYRVTQLQRMLASWWTPAEQSLPEPGEKVIIFCIYKEDGENIDMYAFGPAHWDGEVWYNDENEPVDGFWEVTHWMLPTPESVGLA